MLFQLKLNPLLYLLMALLFIGGCASVKNFNGTSDKNVLIHLQTSNRMLTELHIYDGHMACKLTEHYPYLGMLTPLQGDMEIGLQVDKPHLLVVYFNTKNIFGSQISTTSQRAILTPRVGKKYRIDLSYENDMYDVIIKETDVKTSVSKTLRLMQEFGCK